MSEPRAVLAARVAGGVRALLGRNLAGRGLAMVGGLALAALLGPARFGVLAVMLGFVQTVSAAGAGGLSATLLRRREPPTHEDVQALFTFSLLVGVGVVAAAGIVAWVVLPLAGTATTTARALAVISLTLLVSAWRVAPVCLLERELRYGAIVTVDLGEQLVFYLVAVPLAAGGAGVWSVAAGGVVGAVAAALLALRAERVRLRPTRHLAPVREMWRFGLKYQAAHLLDTVRDFGLNAILLAAAGGTVAGLWALAARLLLVPLALFQALWRIGFVAFARLEERAEAGRAAQETLNVTALAGAAAIAAVLGTAPALVHSVLGDRWERAIVPLALSGAGWAVAAPLSAAVLGLVQSRGDLRAPTVTLLVQIALVWTAAATLAPTRGPWVVGAAWLVALVADAALFLHYSRRYVALSLRAIPAGALVAALAAGAGVGAGALVPVAASLPVAALATAAVWLGAARLLLPAELGRIAAIARPGRLSGSAAVASNA